MIILMSLVGARYISVMKKETKNILEANYHSLEYSRKMLMALDDIKNFNSINSFENNLSKQRQNVTEVGEKEVTDKIVASFKAYQAAAEESHLHAIRKEIFNLMNLNMSAIQRKSNIANETATSATTWIELSGSLCFLIALVLLINLPQAIARPIRELTQSIQEIARQNYHQRVDFENIGEFGELADSFNKMAEKLEEYDNSNLHQLMFEKKRIETLINNMEDAVIGLDEGKRILFANHEGLNILGLKSEEVVGKFAQELSIRNDLFRSLIQELMIKQESMHASKKELKIFFNGKEGYFEKEIINISITPTGENEQRHIGHVIILKNITTFKELELAKTNFIATVSHELKTPIASIKMSLQLLENARTGGLNEDQQQLIASISDDSNRLLKITGELLSMSQVETGNIHLNIQTSRPMDILQIALDAVKTQADQKEVEIFQEIENDLPDIKADTEKTAWVLINFLTNAIRYSPVQSRLKIEVKQENKQVLFSVKDNGKGIEDRYREKIFDRYFQVPESHKTGTGLGLAISKEFIEAQGGRIGVESEIGMGSRFYFTLTSL